MVQIFSQFEDTLKSFKIGTVIRGIYTKDGKEFFKFIQKTKNGFVDGITNDPIDLNRFPRIDYIKTRTSILKYFRKMHRLGKDESVFEFNYTIENNIIDGSAYILRFFSLTVEELYQDTPATIEVVAKKWGKVISRYLKNPALVDKMVDELKKVDSLNLIFSYWPIEISEEVKKPFWLSDIFVFRYFENLHYYNIFKIKDLLLADYEKSNEPAVLPLREAVKVRVMEKFNEATQILNDELKSASEVSDDDSIFEINTVLDMFNKEMNSLDDILIKRNTVNSLLSYWPELLFPAPEYVKI
jgi:hypothetical protein